jgi:hypothetical protein
LGEKRYSSYSLLTSALDGVSGQRHAPAALYPRGKVRPPPPPPGGGGGGGPAAGGARQGHE